METLTEPAAAELALPQARDPSRPRTRGAPGRQHHLDALRSILMILGVFLHASYVYAWGVPWIIKDGGGSRLLLWVNQSIHFFRIPCFFILSGFFARMLTEKQGALPFLKTRMKRLGLPLLSTALVFNTLQAYLLHGNRSGTWDPSAFVASGAFTAFWAGGEWIGHLWFLVYALAFSAAAAALPPGRFRLPGPGPALKNEGRFLGALPLLQAGAFVAAGCLPWLYLHWGGLSAYGLLTYAPFFAFGLWVFMSDRIREEFLRVRAWQAVAACAAIAAELFLGAPVTAWARAIVHYLDAYLVWFCCVLAFAAARLLLRRPSRVFAYLSEAAYSIYLFHHVFVVALAILLAGRQWPPISKFAVVAGASLAASLALHHFLVLRVGALRLLFQGK